MSDERDTPQKETPGLSADAVDQASAEVSAPAAAAEEAEAAVSGADQSALAGQTGAVDSGGSSADDSVSASIATEDSDPGAPVEEAASSHTEVLRAVKRANEPSEHSADSAAEAEATPGPKRASERVVIAEVDESVLPPLDSELPNAAPARDGEIRISADHPMAALYMQTPVPPEMKGNRGVGVLIALVATIGFAAVYAGVLALWLAPQYPPSSYLEGGLLPFVVSVGFAGAALAFFVSLTVLVLIVGRAGWWAYVLGGFPVGVAVWLLSALSYAAHAQFVLGASPSWDPVSLFLEFGVTVPAIAAGLVAREAAIWFGAWIGARGRRVKARNLEAVAEYEASLAEVQAQAS